mmetsp:Transcript_7617/g.15340  ORF Transcript_7617/g.15340 Transcript_7617/m.15340 type:complete len:147 (+) Transcript_7617:62-502(+)
MHGMNLQSLLALKMQESTRDSRSKKMRMVVAIVGTTIIIINSTINHNKITTTRIMTTPPMGATMIANIRTWTKRMAMARTLTTITARWVGEDRSTRKCFSLFASLSNWKQVAMIYCMERGMVWKDVTIGFTVAGIIAAFVPHQFFE